MEKTTAGADLTIGKLLGTLAGVAATIGIFRTLRNSVDRAFARIDTMEQFERVMTTMTGSTEVAEETLAKVNETVKGTAFGLDTAASAVQNFVTSGIEVESATRYFESWGDAVAFYTKGTNQDLENVTDALSKMSTRGKVDMEQLGRIMEAGIPAMDIYAEAMGITTEEVAEQMRKGNLETERFMEVMDEALANGTERFPALTGAAKDAGASWTGTFDNMRAAVTRGVMNIIQSIDDMLTSNGLPDMRQMVANFGKTFENTLNTIADKIPAIVAWIIQVKNNLEPWMPLITQIIAAISGFAIAFAIFNTLRNAITSVKLAVLAFNGALMANPIGLVVALIGALVGVLIYLWNTNEAVREALTTAWEYIKETAIAVWNAIVEFVTPIVDEIVSFIMDIWGMLTDWWVDNQELIMETAETIWNAIQNVIESVMKFLEPFITHTWENIKLAVQVVWETIKTAIEVAITLIQGVLKTVMQLITGDWAGAWETIKSTVSTIFGSVKDFIADTAKMIWDNIKERFQQIVDSVKEKMNNALETVSEIGNNILEFFQNLDLFEAGKAIIQSAIEGILSVKDKILGTVENIVEGVRKFWPFSPAKVGPLRDIHKMDFAGPISKSITRAENPIQRAMENLAETAKSAMSFDIAGNIASTNARVNSRIDHQINHSNSNIEKLLRDALNRKQVIVLDTGEFVGATTEKYNESLGDNYKSKRRWSL